MSDNKAQENKSTLTQNKQRATIMVLIGLIVILLLFIIIPKNDRETEILPTGTVPLSEDDSMSFEFNLTSSGKHSVSLSPGERFTVSYRIYRTDNDEDFPVIAVQNEIEFDPGIFELVEDSISCGYTTSIHTYEDGRCRVFMNAYSVSPQGFEYKQGAEFGSFDLKVRDDASPGSYQITSNRCEMVSPGGEALYSFTVKDLTVKIIDN